MSPNPTKATKPLPATDPIQPVNMLRGYCVPLDPYDSCQHDKLVRDPTSSTDPFPTLWLSHRAVGPRCASRGLGSLPRPREGRWPVQGSIVPCAPARTCSCLTRALPPVPCQAMAVITAPFTEEPRDAQQGRCTALRRGVLRLGLAAGSPPLDAQGPRTSFYTHGPRDCTRDRT